ncbi:MAG: FecR family protein [Alkalispirochaeta sp.]
MFTQIFPKELRWTFPFLIFFFLAVTFGVAGGGQSDDSSGTTRESDQISSGGSTAPGAARSGRIEFLAGDVRVDGAAAEIGAVLGSGSLVQTGSNGLVDIVFGDGNALRIEENTELTLDLADPSRGLDVSRGTVAAVFEGLESIGTGPSDTFRIRTPSTVAGVRGTAFFVRIEDVDRTYVCTCHGVMDFSDQGLTVRAARHTATRFIRRDGDVVAEEAPELYHDSDSLNAVADVAGVTIKWGEEP